jgi:hypothetical protein
VHIGGPRPSLTGQKATSKSNSVRAAAGGVAGFCSASGQLSLSLSYVSPSVFFVSAASTAIVTHAVAGPAVGVAGCRSGSTNITPTASSAGDSLFCAVIRPRHLCMYR